MYFDLNVPLGPVTESGKGRPSSMSLETSLAPVLSEREQRSLNDRLDILVHRQSSKRCQRQPLTQITVGYTVVALNQTIRGQFNAASHQNTLLGIEPRKDILILRRLTIILDEDCEKGFGLVSCLLVLSDWPIILPKGEWKHRNPQILRYHRIVSDDNRRI